MVESDAGESKNDISGISPTVSGELGDGVEVLGVDNSSLGAKCWAENTVAKSLSVQDLHFFLPGAPAHWNLLGKVSVAFCVLVILPIVPQTVQLSVSLDFVHISKPDGIFVFLLAEPASVCCVDFFMSKQ